MDKPQLIQLPKFLDARGNLSFVEQENHIPFVIKRTYWLYDVPGGESRGGHAYKNNQEFIVALSGSFDVILDDGYEKNVFTLNRSYYWREMENFSTNSLAMILSSTDFEENDYIRNYDEFVKMKCNGEI